MAVLADVEFAAAGQPGLEGLMADREKIAAGRAALLERLQTAPANVREAELDAWDQKTAAIQQTIAGRFAALARTFCIPQPSAFECDYFDGDRLIAVGFIDVTPNALSSIYFFYHPDVRPLGLGVASVLFEIEHARRLGIEYVYLG